MLYFLALSLPLLAPIEGQETLSAELQEIVAVAPHEFHRVYAVMDDRLKLSDFDGLVDHLPRGERQQFVASQLRAFADASQAHVLSALAGLEADGHVHRVHQIWINNCIQFRADAHALESIAALDGVAYIQWDPERDMEEMTDAGGPLPTGLPLHPQTRGQLGTAATSYYTEDFESGSFGPEWTTSTTACGRVVVTSLYGANGGNYHAVMDSDTDGCYSTASMACSVDLSGLSTAQIRFAFADYNDEFNSGDDVFEVSDDGGATWHFVGDLSGTDGSYIWMTFDLDPLGLSYGPNMVFRWRWYDNYEATTDGFGIDDIEIADYFPPPPPPDPEENLVKLQAPALWDVGINGTGAVILNIDSGVERSHPDLRNRIWTNPLDPADGIDNDGNGYTDDTWGWDFYGNDNNPDPAGATHGTCTGGIMVGDGSSGAFQTGMAPGAKMAVARVSGESDHWLAQQWGVSVGIDCSSSSHSYKWYFSPQPDYHMHRSVEDMVLAAGIIHANSIGNSGGSSSAPIPWQISAPGLSPSAWRHPDQVQGDGGVSGLMACGGIELDNSPYSPSSIGPSAWEDIRTYRTSYSHSQDSNYWDYSIGGWSGTGQGLVKPDVVTYTNVVTTTNGGGYDSSFGGTSAATPHLGGALALMVSANSHARPRHISETLQRTAIDMGANGKDNTYGAGRIQVMNAALRIVGLCVPLEDEPQMGQPTTLELSGPPTAPWRIYYGMSRGQTTIPGIGDLEIANARQLASGALNASGEYMYTQVVPNNPSLVNATVYLQMATDVSAWGGSWLLSLVEEVTIRP